MTSKQADEERRASISYEKSSSEMRSSQAVPPTWKVSDEVVRLITPGDQARGADAMSYTVAPPSIPATSSGNLSSSKADIFSNDLISSAPSVTFFLEIGLAIAPDFEAEASQTIVVDSSLEIMPMMSDKDDINSLASTRRTLQEVTAEELISKLFIERSDLVPSYQDALSKLGREIC